MILPMLQLYALDAPFDANFRTSSKDNILKYSTRLNLVKFTTPKIILTHEQVHNMGGDKKIKSNTIVQYIKYW